MTVLLNKQQFIAHAWSKTKVSSTTSTVGGPDCGMGSRKLPRMIENQENGVFKKISKRHTINALQMLHADSYGKRYSNLVKHLEVFWEMRSEWALLFQTEIIFRNKNISLPYSSN